MATTRIIPMHLNKGKTLAQCLADRTEYGMNPDKTEGGTLISTFACEPETAVSEFALSKREYRELTGRVQESDVIAYQVRQSFKPGEVTPEEANRIGYEFAKRFLKGRHAFLVCTHTDKKHIHNHIYWNSTALDCTRKFKNFIGSYRAVRRLSDLICAEHRLSVVENPQKHGLSYNKWRGGHDKLSNRDLLRMAIDAALEKQPGDFDALLALLKDSGYSVARKGRLSLRHENQKQSIRLDSLGEGYSEQELRAVIAGSRTHIQDFYLKELERVSASSVIHYHANIHKALKYAVKLDLISSNPADKIERPKKERFMANFYDADEVNRLFEISKGTKLEIPILFGAFYGMRRSETLGMKWDAIDFERDTITIRHTLTTVALDGKRITVAEDRTKNKSSMRTLPLVPFVKERLLELKAEQEENRRLCGRSYVKDYTGYVCINEIGDIIKPNYVSCGFPKLLEEHGLRRVRYHDLRHSCASLLLANGVPMKQIQEWLGHSDFSTTANIYAHLEYSSKVISADAMLAGLGIGNRE